MSSIDPQAIQRRVDEVGNELVASLEAALHELDPLAAHRLLRLSFHAGEEMHLIALELLSKALRLRQVQRGRVADETTTPIPAPLRRVRQERSVRRVVEVLGAQLVEVEVVAGPDRRLGEVRSALSQLADLDDELTAALRPSDRDRSVIALRRCN